MHPASCPHHQFKVPNRPHVLVRRTKSQLQSSNNLLSHWICNILFEEQQLETSSRSNISKSIGKKTPQSGWDKTEKQDHQSSMKQHNEGGAKGLTDSWGKHQHWEELKHLRLSWVFLNGNGSCGHLKDFLLLAFSVLTLRLRIHFHSHLHTPSHTYRSLSIPLLTLHGWAKTEFDIVVPLIKDIYRSHPTLDSSVHSYTLYKYLYSLTFCDSLCFRLPLLGKFMIMMMMMMKNIRLWLVAAAG